MGVFALRSFQPGDVVLRWDVSHLIRKADTSQLPETERHYTHPFDNDRLVLVQPPERFVNHSCDNNTEVRDFSDVAIRDIHPGEELTSNYSDGAGFQFICACGFENCRGKVG